jgi:hypothetical protein
MNDNVVMKKLNTDTGEWQRTEPSADFDTLINELDATKEIEITTTDEEISISSKKPSWLAQIRSNFNSLYPKPIYTPTAKRLQSLAGIKMPSVARLTTKDGTLELKDYPTFFDLMRYKVCGIKYEILIDKNQYE